MSLVRYDPFRVLREFDRLFDVEEGTPGGDRTWRPRVDVLDEEGALMVRAEIPGVDPESIDVTLEGDTLAVSGSRKFEDETTNGGFHRKEIFEGSFRRMIRLPDGVDAEAVKATSKDGILEITVPRRPEVLPRKVTVDVQR